MECVKAQNTNMNITKMCLSNIQLSQFQHSCITSRFLETVHLHKTMLLWVSSFLSTAFLKQPKPTQPTQPGTEEHFHSLLQPFSHLKEMSTVHVTALQVASCSSLPRHSQLTFTGMFLSPVTSPSMPFFLHKVSYN